MERTVISSVKRADGLGYDFWSNPSAYIAEQRSNNPELNNYLNGNNSSGSDSGNSSGIWDLIFSNAGGWISSISGGIASIVQAKTGNYPTYQQDNTPKVLAIAGIGAVVLIIILVIIFKK